MKNLKISTFIISLFLCNLVLAQEQVPKVIVMGVPQYMFKNGLRFDIDIASKDYKSWWVVSPQFYVDVSDVGDNSNNKYEQMHGYGLSLYRKGFLSGKHADRGIYISGGLGYQYFNMLEKGEHWVEINDDGLNYVHLSNENYHIYINKVITDAIIGFQKQLFNRMYVDLFVGFGLRYSFYDRPSGSNIKFNKSSIDYGYTGTIFIGGLRIGVGL